MNRQTDRQTDEKIPTDDSIGSNRSAHQTSNRNLDNDRHG